MGTAKVGSAEWMRSLVKEIVQLQEAGTRLQAELDGEGPRALDALLATVHRVREAVGEPEAPTDLLVRGMSPRALERFKVGSGARALKYADYLAALLDLHDARRRLADSGDDDVAAILTELGLSTVTA